MESSGSSTQLALQRMWNSTRVQKSACQPLCVAHHSAAFSVIGEDEQGHHTKEVPAVGLVL